MEVYGGQDGRDHYGGRHECEVIAYAFVGASAEGGVGEAVPLAAAVEAFRPESVGLGPVLRVAVEGVWADVHGGSRPEGVAAEALGSDGAPGDDPNRGEEPHRLRYHHGRAGECGQVV